MSTAVRIIRRLAAGAVLAAVALAPVRARAQGGEGGEAIAVAGLRPTSDGSYRTVDLKRLPESQRLRQTVEEVVHELAGRPVLGHAGLRAMLGSSYLVTFFDCGGAVSCVTRAFAKALSTSHLLVYGDYTARGGRYQFRIRLIDLATGKLLAETEFPSAASEIEEPERWKRELAGLIATIEATGKAVEGSSANETGGGQTATGTGEEAAESAGEATESAGDATQSAGGAKTAESPEGSDVSVDDLTDADFGQVELSDASVGRDSERDDIATVQMMAGIGLWTRRLDFDSAAGQEIGRPDGFRGSWTPRLQADVELYPLARRDQDGFLNRFGLVGDVAQTLGGGSGDDAARETRFRVALAYRVALGASPTLPTFKATAGYLQQIITLPGEGAAVPDVVYRAAALGLDAVAPLGTPRVALRAGARYLIAQAAGDMGSADQYGGSTAGGVDVSGSVDIVVSWIVVRVGATYTRLATQFDGEGLLAGPSATGVRDRSFGYFAAAGLMF